MTATPRRLALFFLLSLVWSVSSCWPANSKAKPLRYREQHLPKKVGGTAFCGGEREEWYLMNCVAVLHHVSFEDIGPTDSCPLSENVLGVRRSYWVLPGRRPEQFKNTW
jgi:hypothetical protein